MFRFHFLFVFVILLIATNVLFAQWSVQATLAHDLNAVFFIDENRGWAAADAPVIYRTTNGGQNWTPSNLPNAPADVVVNDVIFVAQNEGWAVGGRGQGAGMVWRSSNGGATWTLVRNSPAVDPALNALDFVNQSEGTSVGGGVNGLDFGICISTDNGGSTWNLLMDGSVNIAPSCTSFPTNYTPTAMRSVSTPSSSNWWLVGDDRTILFSGMMGADFCLEPAPPQLTQDDDLLDVTFLTGTSTGWAVGGQAGRGVVIERTSGGAWMTQVNGSVGGTVVDQLNGVSFLSSSQGWAAGNNGIIIHTSDGGSNWTIEAGGVSNDLSDVFFLNETTGWAVGQGGVVLSKDPATPRIISPRNVVAGPADANFDPFFRWTDNNPGSTGRLEIRDGNGNMVVQMNVSSQRVPISSLSAQLQSNFTDVGALVFPSYANSYEWRVRAELPNGRLSPFSPWTYFAYEDNHTNRQRWRANRMRIFELLSSAEITPRQLNDNIQFLRMEEEGKEEGEMEERSYRSEITRVRRPWFSQKFKEREKVKSGEHRMISDIAIPLEALRSGRCYKMEVWSAGAEKNATPAHITFRYLRLGKRDEGQ